jgi:hypothetical protein
MTGILFEGFLEQVEILLKGATSPDQGKYVHKNPTPDEHIDRE